MNLKLVYGDRHIVMVISGNEEILRVKMEASAAFSIPIEEIEVLFRGRPLEDHLRVSSIGMQFHLDHLQIRAKATPPAPAPASIDIGSLAARLAQGIHRPAPRPQPVARQDDTDPAVFRAYVMNEPDLLTNLLNNDRVLAEAVLSDDDYLLSSLLRERKRARQEQEAQKIAEIERLNADPLNLEAQALIEGKIQEENILENMETAVEHHPESFGRVVMLYIPVEVNGVPVKAFVDSGAQQTIMSVDCAERCGIMRLVDRRFAGIAQGVGTAKILGRVHLAPIKIGNTFFPCSFTILVGQNLEFLLGLDMLRRHQCNIDLKDNVLRIQNEAVAFLPEKDIPEKEKNNELTPEQLKQLEEQNKKEEPTKSENKQPVLHPAPAPPPQNTQENVIKQLMDLGFPRSQVLEALEVCGGNAEMAASYLLSNT
uniref:DNA damage-inducible protein 1 n=1 Tax=Arcella intermedia TaxID=1963864 RepID=A0A6B2L4R3_9EUKA